MISSPSSKFDNLKKFIALLPLRTIRNTTTTTQGGENSHPAPTLKHPTHGLQQLREAEKHTTKICKHSIDIDQKIVQIFFFTWQDTFELENDEEDDDSVLSLRMKSNLRGDNWKRLFPPTQNNNRSVYSRERRNLII